MIEGGIAEESEEGGGEEGEDDTGRGRVERGGEAGAVVGQRWQRKEDDKMIMLCVCIRVHLYGVLGV